MFKKLILALICLLFTLSGFAEELVATLQSGDKVTPIYGVNAFVEAHNAAVNGDVITLSPRTFNVKTIEKSITVIGTYAFSTDLSKATKFSSPITISGDNVTLEGIRFTDSSSGLVISGADNLTINRCYIELINDEKYHNNTILTDCFINKFNAMSLSENAVLRNCSVCYFYDMNDKKNIALIENCNVTQFSNYSYSDRKQPYAIYRNCCFGLYKITKEPYIPYVSFSAPTELYNNCFYETYAFYYGSDYAKSWDIIYGTAIHVNNINVSVYSTTDYYPAYASFTPYSTSYGPINHKEYPAVPFISSSTIGTDANGNLHVKITAKARD